MSPANVRIIIYNAVQASFAIFGVFNKKKAVVVVIIVEEKNIYSLSLIQRRIDKG